MSNPLAEFESGGVDRCPRPAAPVSHRTTVSNMFPDYHNTRGGHTHPPGPTVHPGGSFLPAPHTRDWLASGGVIR